MDVCELVASKLKVRGSHVYHFSRVRQEWMRVNKGHKSLLLTRSVFTFLKAKEFQHETYMKKLWFPKVMTREGRVDFN